MNRKCRWGIISIRFFFYLLWFFLCFHFNSNISNWSPSFLPKFLFIFFDSSSNIKWFWIWHSCFPNSAVSNIERNLCKISFILKQLNKIKFIIIILNISFHEIATILITRGIFINLIRIPLHKTIITFNFTFWDMKKFIITFFIPFLLWICFRISFVACHL